MLIKMVAMNLPDYELLKLNDIQYQEALLEDYDGSHKKGMVNKANFESWILSNSCGFMLEKNRVLYRCIINIDNNYYLYNMVSKISGDPGAEHMITYDNVILAGQCSGVWKYYGNVINGSWIHDIFPLYYQTETSKPIVKCMLKDGIVFYAEIYGEIPNNFFIKTVTGEWIYHDGWYKKLAV